MQDAVKGHWIAASHTPGLATPQSCSCRTQVGFALAKNAEFLSQQHHCWEVQQTSFANRVDLSQQKCWAKETGLSEAIKTRPCSKQLLWFEVLLPLPFSLSPTATVYHSSTKSYQTNYLCVTVIRRDYICSPVVSCHTSSRPLPLGWPPESRAGLCTTQINCMCAFFSASSAIKDRTAAESQDRCL